jgi:hypothetical protein
MPAQPSTAQHTLKGCGVLCCQHCAAAVSHVFRDEIEQQQGLGGRPSIHLDVRPDQVQAACALVRFVYTGEGGGLSVFDVLGSCLSVIPSTLQATN